MINELRPTSLLKIIIKIITKVLANWLCPHILLIVGQAQSAFTKNRYILDGVTYAHEILAASRNSDLEEVKIDFGKAFDFVSWDFLFELLFTRGFRQR